MVHLTKEPPCFELIFFLITKLRCPIDVNVQSRFGLRYILNAISVILEQRHKIKKHNNKEFKIKITKFSNAPKFD